jgi:hypothetical protein
MCPTFDAVAHGPLALMGSANQVLIRNSLDSLQTWKTQRIYASQDFSLPPDHPEVAGDRAFLGMTRSPG